MIRNSSSLVGVIVALGVCLVAPRAQASETYPAAVQKALGLACAPACVLCHSRPEGGLGQLNTGFGRAIYDTGVSYRNPGGIPAALDCIENGVESPEETGCRHLAGEVRDSDGDGAPDIEELRNAEDPNSSESGSFCGARYGCGASIAPPKAELDGLASASALFVAGALFWTLRRRWS